MISDGKNKLLKIGLNPDVITCFQRVYEQYKDQPIEIVEELQTNDTIDFKCQSVYDHMCKYVYYKIDKDGDQFIKTPARLIRDGFGDCKSFTMFVACCLHCLGIPFIVRFVNFDGTDQYTHVYPVAIDEAGQEIIMDMCETSKEGIPYYGYARPYKKKKDLYYGR